MAVDELKRLVKEEDGDVYAVHGGRIVTARMVDQLGDGAVIQFVDRMLGGGKKKMMKVEQSDQSATDKSSTEADAVFEVFDRCSQTGVGGLSGEMMEAMLDEQTERMLRMIRSSFAEEVGGDPEMVIEGIRKFVQERRQRKTSTRRRGRKAVMNVKKRVVLRR